MLDQNFEIGDLFVFSLRTQISGHHQSKRLPKAFTVMSGRLRRSLPTTLFPTLLPAPASVHQDRSKLA